MGLNPRQQNSQIDLSMEIDAQISCLRKKTVSENTQWEVHSD